MGVVGSGRDKASLHCWFDFMAHSKWRGNDLEAWGKRRETTVREGSDVFPETLDSFVKIQVTFQFDCSSFLI